MASQWSHIASCVRSMVCFKVHGHLWCILTSGCRASALQSVVTSGRFWLPSGHGNTSHIIDETWLWMQKWWSNQGTRVDLQYKSSISLTYLCQCDVQNVCVAPIWCICLRTLLIELLGRAWQRSNLRYVNWTSWIAHENSIIIGGSVSAEAIPKPSTVEWFCRLPSQYHMTATKMANTFLLIFQRWLLYNEHQSHPTLINVLKFVDYWRHNIRYRSCLTLLINRVSCICEGQSWWVPVVDIFLLSLFSLHSDRVLQICWLRSNVSWSWYLPFHFGIRYPHQLLVRLGFTV